MERIQIIGQNTRNFVHGEIRTDIGTRRSQQDAAWGCAEGEHTLIMVCDGIGGAQGGEQASRTAAKTMENLFQSYLSGEIQEAIPAFLYRAMKAMDQAVCQALAGQDGGTTVVAALIHGYKLYWLSVGDSRMYILRDGDMVQATRDHNRLLRLNNALEAGQITREQYEEEKKNGENLISFVGMGGISEFDLTEEPLELRQGDLLLLTTDGLYKAMPLEVIRYIVLRNVPLEKRADQLISQITALRMDRSLDNTTFALIKIKE